LKAWQPNFGDQNFQALLQKFGEIKMFLVARSMVDIEAWLIKQLKHAKVFETMIKFFFYPPI
jgi:hypothetical protein